MTPDMPDASVVPPAEPDVARWVGQARLGSQAAFSALHARFSPMVHAILLGRFRAHLADDLTQECFVVAFHRLGQLKAPDKFGPWIATIARRIQPPADRGKVTEAPPEQLPATSATPDEVAERDQLLRAIGALPAAYRETLLMRFAEGMSGPEIARATGLTHASVRVNLHRGMARLRQALDLAPPSGGHRND